MRDGLVPAGQTSDSALADPYRGQVTPEPAVNPMERPLAAVRRYKWLILAVTALSGFLGVVGMRFITPKYETRATVWVSSTNPNRQSASDRIGPIRSAELLNSGQWIDLFRSYRVVDEVVRKLTLYVTPAEETDRILFTQFSLANRFVPGAYELTMDGRSQQWILRDASGAEVERGAATDSVGRKVGFMWVLPAPGSPGGDERTVRFNVVPPRDKSLDLLNRVGNRIAMNSNFLWLTFSDVSPTRAQRILNIWVDEFVHVAADLKKSNLVEFSRILEGQLQTAERATQEAEAAYQRFRVNTIILPTEGGPVAAGATGGSGSQAAQDPALTSFFDQKIEYDNLRHDREALEQTIASAATARGLYEGVLLIPSVASGPGAEGLRDAFSSLYALQADLRTKKVTFTDQHPAVIEVAASIEVLRKQTIPTLANQLLEQLRARENDYQRRISAASRELREIPPRTIEERRLSRAVTVAEGLYTNLKSRYAEAQLAEAGATPDVNVLDTAVAPLTPTKNTAAMMLLGAVLGGLGAAIALALLLDQIDRRIRYAHQATADLGLTIAGAVPQIPKGGINANSPEQVSQFIESFRTLRMHVMNSVPGQRLTLAVTSAAPGDGKTLVSTNLALSFAEVGLKTVLIDGDTRRGVLHRLHGLQAAGGLTEYLAGLIDVDQAVRATSQPNLSFVSCGARHPRSPELLASPRLKHLVETLSKRFDAVIFDTPPLAAGIDGYAISAAAGHVLMVLRMGQTEKRLASAKLTALDRLQVDIVGAALNAVPSTGEFQYYVYASEYAVHGEPAGELAATNNR